MSYKTYIFDFDYTLADATVGICDSVNYALTQMGLSPKRREEIRKTVGMTLGDIFFTLTGISDESSAETFNSHFMYNADRVVTNTTVLFPDTIDVLTKLKQKGCNTAVVTTKVRYRVEEIQSKFNMQELIDYTVGLEDVEAPKPSPEGLLKAIARFGNDKQTVLFIGDSLIDANTAKNANVDFAAVLTGTTTKQEFQALPHILIAENLTEIITNFLEY